ncbi:hypothetical protein MHH81_20675 [Psychrobacillus sp. FSL H8-0484]|uniref:hypothetical protein n=1 Tax=Psychrobacillus sp. FSL H8-0484 TaxID=2921390 RepID=UPI0030FBE046
MKKAPIAKMTSKGQVTLPKKIRDVLKADTGTHLLFSIEPANQRVYIEVLNAKNTCPHCEGNGQVEDEPCFICLERGVIPSPFHPSEFFAVWMQSYEIQINFSLETTIAPNGYVLLPELSLQSDTYPSDIPRYMTDMRVHDIADLILYYLFIEFVVNHQDNWREHIEVFQERIHSTKWKMKLANL